ncbi:hypothetical protein [uncultured Nostoc sp.]|uniref:hypothetical protein n=1 Tax=uncultured Nostoc sp. TaxID=340711 RepID=UPI0035CBAE34
MESSSLPPEMYADQALLAAQELDFDLHLAACESEIAQAVRANFEPMPKADPPKAENSVYNFNRILDFE